MLQKCSAILFSILFISSCATIPKSTQNVWEKVADKTLEKVVLIEVRNADMKLQGIGSGVVISPDGWILTNRHVADGQGKAWYAVHFYGERFYVTDNVIIYDDADLALIKIDAKNLPFVRIRNTAPIIGEPCMSIGNPLPYTFATSTGIVSQAKASLYMPSEAEYMVHTATIFPGNSGGPVLDHHGYLIGLNTAVYRNVPLYALAIPARIIMQFLGLHDLGVVK